VNRARKTTLFICATCILPVMFATQIGTRFNVDEKFFANLQSETFTTEETKIVDGKEVSERVERTVPVGTQSQLRSLLGMSYASAKEFIQAVAQVIPSSDAKHMESAFMNSARSDKMYWISVLLIALAAAGHQAWSANIFTLVSDVFPKKATASITGIGGMVGAVAGLLADFSLGRVLTASGPSGYFFAFLIAGSCYLIILGIVHLIMPKMTPLDENLKRVSA
jgi:hypothetical protein